MMIRWLAVILVAVSAILLGASACSTNTITNPQDVVFPDSGVSYIRHVQPFLTLSCGFAACHGDANPAGGVRLTSYTAVMFTSRPNLAVPGKPDESLIIQVLDKRIPHSIAVLDRVTSNQYRGMRRWITEGAINN